MLHSAKVAEGDKEYEAAIYSLKDLINSYPDSPYSAEAYFNRSYLLEFIKGPEYDLESTREAIAIAKISSLYTQSTKKLGQLKPYTKECSMH